MGLQNCMLPHQRWKCKINLSPPTQHTEQLVTVLFRSIERSFWYKHAFCASTSVILVQTVVMSKVTNANILTLQNTVVTICTTNLTFKNSTFFPHMAFLYVIVMIFTKNAIFLKTLTG
jgi:hypothetical protein